MADNAYLPYPLEVLAVILQHSISCTASPDISCTAHPTTEPVYGQARHLPARPGVALPRCTGTRTGRPGGASGEPRRRLAPLDRQSGRYRPLRRHTAHCRPGVSVVAGLG